MEYREGADIESTIRYTALIFAVAVRLTNDTCACQCQRARCYRSQMPLDPQRHRPYRSVTGSMRAATNPQSG